MTQDPYGQPPGPGHVVAGEVVADDEANVTPDTYPMTRFQKVASALRGDRTDPAMPIPQDADPDAPAAQADANAEEDADATPTEEVAAVRSPDGGSRDYWDETDGPRPDQTRSDQTWPDATAASATFPAAADTIPPDAASPSPAAAADVGTEQAWPDEQDPTMTQPDLYGATPRGGAVPAAAEAAEMAGSADPGPTGTVAPEATVPGPAGVTTEPVAADAADAGVVGKHAAAPAQEGMRPGESDRTLGDFSDLLYGSLLPDAAEFKAQWQRVQFRFVDDPQGSVTEAADVVAQLTAKLEAAIQERQRAIAERQSALRARWSEGKTTDTESLRETLLMYRTFLDQLTEPKTS